MASGRSIIRAAGAALFRRQAVNSTTATTALRGGNPLAFRNFPQNSAVSSRAATPSSFSSSTLGILRLSGRRLGSNFEDYYGMVEYATKIQSPMVMYMWWGWAVSQVVICAAALFHSNYYFSGRMLPKTQGNTQLCEDSW